MKERYRLTEALNSQENNQEGTYHYHLYDRHNMKKVRDMLDHLNKEGDTYEGPVMYDPKGKIPVQPTIKLAELHRLPRDRERDPEARSYQTHMK